MSTYRHLVYIIMDELKLSSDDSFYTEEHILYLLGKHRATLLKQQYKDIKKPVEEANYQTICLEMMQVPAISGEICEGGTYLKSKDKIPFLINITSPRIYPEDFYNGDITYVNRDRMRFVGDNKYLKNIIYASLGPDNYLYLKSSNPQFLYLDNVKMSGIFESPEKVAELDCNKTIPFDIMDEEFPLEEGLVPLLINSILRELTLTSTIYNDKKNDADDETVADTRMRNKYDRTQQTT